MKKINPLVDPILRMSARGMAFTLRDGAQNAFAADFHSRRRCAMSWARSSSLPLSST
jgi:hypothetical protein